MTPTIKPKTKRQRIGYILGQLCLMCLICLFMQMSVAAERWKIVVLPDTNYNTPIELPTLADYRSTISQGLTIALVNGDFDVLNLHYLGLPNCVFEDCSSLTDHAIRQTAKNSGREVNLALLYQLNAFKQRHGASQKWYFSLSGRLLDLQSGAQQDAFTVDNWVNSPAKNCISDCLSLWVNQNLELLAQDLGTVLSEKLDVLPRRFYYQLNLNNFNGAELQKIDSYLKNIDGYVADILLADSLGASQNKNHTLDHNTLVHNTQRTYQYISQLTGSELGAKLAKLNKQYALPLKFEYDNTQRQFILSRNKQNDSWATLSQFITGLFPSSEENTPLAPSSHSTSALIDVPPSQLTVTTVTTDKDKEALRDQQMWQQARSINTMGSYQQYLSIWPQGQHLIQAEAAIQAFYDDENSWQQASNKKTSQAFQQYLSLKPTGKYSNQAKQQLVLLREQQQREQKQREHKTLAEDYYHQQKNYPEALYYYQQSANLGDASSQYLLGKMYEDAKGTKKNVRQAANWYAKAAKQGHSKAQATLGFMYSKGNGVNQDYSQAVNWYQKAAEQGHIDAQYNLAYLYSLGQGVEINYQQAAYWYQKSAIQGDDDAQNNLGKLYERGLGVNKNVAKAKSLYQQAANQGNQIAQLNLQMLNN
jgi:TPR repeat protein